VRSGSRIASADDVKNRTTYSSSLSTSKNIIKIDSIEAFCDNDDMTSDDGRYSTNGQQSSIDRRFRSFLVAIKVILQIPDLAEVNYRFVRICFGALIFLYKNITTCWMQYKINNSKQKKSYFIDHD
jgi:hypothetical protein